jgi:hypothetical protein
MGIKMSPPAWAGTHLLTSFCQDCGRRVTRSGTTNSSVVDAAIAPAVNLRIILI